MIYKAPTSIKNQGAVMTLRVTMMMMMTMKACL